MIEKKKPREITLEFGYEGRLVWPPHSPVTKVSESVLFREVLAAPEISEEEICKAGKDYFDTCVVIRDYLPDHAESFQAGIRWALEKMKGNL